jgi:hypothetical protein
VKVKESEPGGTSGPLTLHGQLPGVIDETTVVVRPVGGLPLLTEFSTMLTDCAPLPRYCGSRFAAAPFFVTGRPTVNDVGTNDDELAGCDADGAIADPLGGAEPPPPHAVSASTQSEAMMRGDIDYRSFRRSESIVNPLLVTVIGSVTCCADASVKVARHVPGLTPVTVTFHVGPDALDAENVAIGEFPPQLLLSLKVPV